MSRTYAQIDCSLLHSRKYRRLNHLQKSAYTSAHLSLLGNFIGIFRYPKASWAYDADISHEEMDEAISAMQQVGLIQYDEDEGFVRIVDWFFKKNAPDNASTMIRMVKDFAELEAPDAIFLASAAEFAVGSIKRALRWKPDSPDWPKLREAFKLFLKNIQGGFEDDFLQELKTCLEGQSNAVRAEISALLPTLPFYLEARCPHPVATVAAHETKRDVDETKTKIDLDYTGKNLEVEREPCDAVSNDTSNFAEKRVKASMPCAETIAFAKREGLT